MNPDGGQQRGRNENRSSEYWAVLGAFLFCLTVILTLFTFGIDGKSSAKANDQDSKFSSNVKDDQGSKSSSSAKEDGSAIVQAVKDDPFILVRWAFNYLLTPVAVISVFYILIRNIIRIVNEGFRSDTVEGYKRVCAAVLPLAFFVYAVVVQKAPAAALTQDGVKDLSKWLASVPSVNLLVLSGAAGVGVAKGVEVGTAPVKVQKSTFRYHAALQFPDHVGPEGTVADKR